MDSWSWAQEPGFIVGSAIGVAGIIIGIILHYRQRRPKRLDYMVLTNVPIETLAVEGDKPRLQVMFAGMELANPRVITLRLINTGREPVTDSDYAAPLTITWDDAIIRDCGVIGSSAPDMLTPQTIRYLFNEVDGQPDISGGIEEIRLQPNCMNADESIDLRIVVDGGDKLAVACRVVGQTRSMRRIPYRPSSRYGRADFGADITLSVTLATGIGLLLVDEIRATGWLVALSIICIVLGTIPFLGLLFRVSDYVTTRWALRDR